MDGREIRQEEVEHAEDGSLNADRDVVNHTPYDELCNQARDNPCDENAEEKTRNDDRNCSSATSGGRKVGSQWDENLRNTCYNTDEERDDFEDDKVGSKGYAERQGAADEGEEENEGSSANEITERGDQEKSCGIAERRIRMFVR